MQHRVERFDFTKQFSFQSVPNLAISRVSTPRGDADQSHPDVSRRHSICFYASEIILPTWILKLLRQVCVCCQEPVLPKTVCTMLTFLSRNLLQTSQAWHFSQARGMLFMRPISQNNRSWSRPIFPNRNSPKARSEYVFRRVGFAQTMADPTNL